MKIAIFGGTFNPIHKGHIKILENIKSNVELDYIYIVPTYQTPDKNFIVEKIKPIYKYKMIKNAVNDYKFSWLKYSKNEIKRKGISYTIDTVRYFEKKFPNSELYLIIGDDCYDKFDSWKNSKKILEKTKLIVYKRYGFNENELIKNEDLIYINDKTYNYSSTEILNNLELNKIPSSTLEFIAKKNLYLKTMVFYKLYEKRYDHSISVATHASRLAKRNFLFFSYKKAYLAGLVHDIFKYEDSSWMVNYISKYSDYKIPPKPALHGYAASIWLKNEYGIKDNKILNSIKNHTIPNLEMKKFEKIIYVSDKISNDRKDKNIGHLRRQAYNNFDLTFKKIVKQQVNKLKEKNIKIDEDTLSVYNKYFKK